MKTNITIDNYEAYLLDYMEGNLGPDEAEQLKAFVAAQDLDWNELTEELPHLEAPQIEFENKERLKKKGTLTPLYVKIASAAAAAGLLLTVTLWPDRSMPKVEPVTELKPILPERLITAEETTTLTRKTIPLAQTQAVKKRKPANSKLAENTLIAQLKPQKAQAIPITADIDEPDFDLLVRQMNNNLTLALNNETNHLDHDEEERNLSLIGKGIYLLTNGAHDSFASLISTGLSTAKKEISLAATDFAMTAYYRADERFEEAKENRRENREE